MQQHRVVIVGGGFAGLQAAKDLAGHGLMITIIDRRNHHLFQPLLYQVATTLLATSEIAWPIRSVFRRNRNVSTILGEVVAVDKARRRVALQNGHEIEYDTLVLATGAQHAYFGHDEWEAFAPGLKTLEDATTIRRRLLLAFENAELEKHPTRRRALLTFAIIGGGATGVELAGIVAQLACHTLMREFRSIDTTKSRILLVEAGPRLLSAFHPELSAYAASALSKLGVEVRTDTRVTGCSGEGISIGDEFVPARTVIWAAGVQASKAGQWIGAEVDQAGRVIVTDNLNVIGHPEIFVVGDTARVRSINGGVVPGIAPAAKQQGKYVANTIVSQLAGVTEPEPFRYRHQGNLATIGPNSAVIELGRFRLRGWLAWWLWGLAHVYFLIGTRSRLAVALSWLWTAMTGLHSSRLITQKETRREAS